MSVSQWKHWLDKLSAPSFPVLHVLVGTLFRIIVHVARSWLQKDRDKFRCLILETKCDNLVQNSRFRGQVVSTGKRGVRGV